MKEPWSLSLGANPGTGWLRDHRDHFIAHIITGGVTLIVRKLANGWLGVELERYGQFPSPYMAAFLPGDRVSDPLSLRIEWGEGEPEFTFDDRSPEDAGWTRDKRSG